MEPDRRFVDCDYCGAASVLDLGAAATCFRVRETFDGETADKKLRGWLRGKGLQDKGIEIKKVSELLIPFWVLEADEGKVSLLAVERADLPLSPNSRTPVGQLESFDPEEMDLEGTTPLEWTIPMSVAAMRLVAPEAQERASRSGLQPSLLYAPYFSISYSYAGTPYEALMDACSGEVHAINRPRTRDDTIDRNIFFLLGAAVALDLIFSLFVPGFWLVLFLYVAAAVPIAWGLSRTIVTVGSKR